MFNFLKKSKKTTGGNSDDNGEKDDVQQMGFMQKIMMKKVMNMSDTERMKLMQKVLTPENIAKNKDKIMPMLENMKNSGQVSADQYEMIKQKLNLS